MSTNNYQAAFEQAQAELNVLRDEFEVIRKRKEQLEALLSSLRPLVTNQQELPLDLPPRPIDFSAALAIDRRSARKSPNGTRKLAIEAIEKAGRPLSVPDIHRYVLTRVGGMAPKPESIRVLMIRRGDTFQQMGDGLYGLKKDHDEAERSAEDAIA